MVAEKKRARLDPSFRQDDTNKPRNVGGGWSRRLPRVEDFMDLEVSHPYGILPGGNQFLASATLNNANFFSDSDGEACLQILSFCDGVDLARLAQTCRFLYAVSHQLELWRDLVLRYINKHEEVLQDMQPSWKDTYVHLVLQHSMPARNETIKPHLPMAVPGVYSDFFYRLHSCRTFCIPKSWLLESCAEESAFAVRCIPFSEMSTGRFYQEFEQTNRPVLVRGAASQWKANTAWSAEYLSECTRGRDFRATSGAAPLPAQFSFHAYRQYCHWEHLEEAPLYLFDRTALQTNSQLWKDYHPDLLKACPYWDADVCPQHDLFALFGEGRRPDHTWWIVGPKRSGSVFHMDPNATHAWNAAIRGRKRWIFYPPGVPPPGVHPSADADQVALPWTVGEWIFQFWSQHVDRLRHSVSPQEQPLECTAFPGDVVFVPHGWWHMVINLDDGLNVAITHNYVSSSNLSNVLKFLNEKEDQISGCRDREESIKPNQLYSAFVETLQQQRPEMLEGALAVRDWTCRAWASNGPLEEAPLLEQDKNQTFEHESSKCKNMTNIMAKAKPSDDEPNRFNFSFL